MKTTKQNKQTKQKSQMVKIKEVQMSLMKNLLRVRWPWLMNRTKFPGVATTRRQESSGLIHIHIFCIKEGLLSHYGSTGKF